MELLSHIAGIEAALLLMLGARVVHASPAARSNLLFGLLALVQASWAAAYGLMVHASDLQMAWLWYRVGAVGWTFGPVVVWHFVAALTERQSLFRRPWLLLCGYAPAAVIFGRQLTRSVFAVELIPTPFGWGERVALDNPWTYATVAHYVGFASIALFWVYRWGKASRHPARTRHAKIVLIAGVATLVAVSATNVAPHFFGVNGAPGLAPMIVPAWLVALWRTIGKHELRTLDPEAAARRMLRAMSDAVLLLSPSDVVLQANRAAGSLFGVEPEALVGRRLSEFLPGQPNTAMRRRVSGGTMFRSEVLYERKGAKPVTLSVTAALVSDEGGDVLGTAMILRDISERKRWELELRRREEHFRGLIENIADIILIVDVEGHIRYASPSFHRLQCDAADSGRGGSLIDQLHEEDRGTFRERALAPAARGSGPNRVEVRCGRPDGSWRVLEVVSAPLEDSEGQAILVSARDVTERKEMEARLARTERERLEDQLVQANRLASAGLLAASVSHEINNPLALIIGNLELASGRLRRLAPERRSDDASPPANAREHARRDRVDQDAGVRAQRLADIARWVQEAIDGGWRIERIVRDLRSFARGGGDEAGPVDVNAVVERTLGLAAAQLDRRAEVVRELGTVPHARAAEGLVGQVLLNLLINALHALDPQAKPRPRIIVRTHADDADVLLEVEDTGAGIAEADRERIFDPFFTTKTAGQGSGLGLWVARHVVQAWRGSIEVRSTPGSGSTFCVRIPRADRARASEPVGAEPGQPIDDTIGRGSVEPGARDGSVEPEPPHASGFPSGEAVARDGRAGPSGGGPDSDAA